MKKAIIILSTLALLSCNSTGKKQSADIAVDCTDGIEETIGAYSFTELGLACRSGDLNKVKALIEKGACKSLCMTDNEYLYDVLYTAVLFEKTELVKYFIGIGENVNQVYGYTSTALTLACSIADTTTAFNIAKLLLEAGANVNGIYSENDDWQHYPLLEAIDRNNTGLVNLLIEYHADTDIEDEVGNNVLEKFRNWAQTDVSKLPVSERWYGNYYFTINEDHEDWRDMQDIQLRIDNDTITFKAEGYQVYQYYLLNVKENENELHFTYSKTIDTNLESAILKETKDFGTLIFDGKKYLWNCPYIDMSFGDDKKATYVLKK